MRCVIITGGEFGAIDFSYRPDDFIICCDRGYDYACRAGVVPNLIMGDLDSLEGTLPEHIEILSFAKKKDDSDTMLAIKEALARGYSSIALLYATGNRLDHTIANISALAYIINAGATGAIYGVREEVHFLKNETLVLSNRAGQSLSVFSWGDRATGVTLRGVAYPLSNATLTNTIPLGLSNCIESDYCEISVQEGSLGIFLSKEE